MNSINLQGFNAELQSGLLEKAAHELTSKADLENMKAKVRAKYPDMLKKEKDSNAGMGTYGPSSGVLPGMVGGPGGGMGLPAMGSVGDPAGRA